jgi:hypothetical protein
VSFEAFVAVMFQVEAFWVVTRCRVSTALHYVTTHKTSTLNFHGFVTWLLFCSVVECCRRLCSGIMNTQHIIQSNSSML